MMTSLMTADAVVSVRCSCPILVLLQWDVEMLSLGFAVVVVVDENAKHARCDDSANFFLVDDLGDAVPDLADVAALFLYDVVIPVLL